MNIPAKKPLKILCWKEICYRLVFLNLVCYLLKINKLLHMNNNLNCSSRDVYFQLQLIINKELTVLIVKLRLK